MIRAIYANDTMTKPIEIIGSFWDLETAATEAFAKTHRVLESARKSRSAAGVSRAVS